MPRLLVATLGRGLLRSDDLGRSWTTEPGLPSAGRFLALHAGDVGGRELLVGTEHAVHRYAGGAWTEMPLPAGGGALSALTSVDGVVLAGTGPLGLLRSTSGAPSWERLSVSLPSPAPAARPGRIAALLPNPLVAREIWAAIESAGVFASEDAGTSWSPANDAIPSLDVNALAWSSGGVLVAAMPTGVAIWRSARWMAGQVEPGDRDCRALACRPDDPGTLYCGFGDPTAAPRGGVAVSRDGGRSWRTCALPGPVGSPIGSVATSAESPALVVAGSLSGEVYLSLDAALTWRHVMSAGAESRAVGCFAG